MRIGFFGKPVVADETPVHELPLDDRFIERPAHQSIEDHLGQPELRSMPPQLPPSLLRELERVIGRRDAALSQQFQSPPHQTYAPPSRPAPAHATPAVNAIHYTGTLDGGVLDAIHGCRAQLEQALIADAKEYQILKMLKETDLGVCSELASELQQRLASHALFQIIAKLDEAYAMALRYQTPRANVR